MKRALFVMTAILAGACVVTPPAHWASGGAALDLPRARWVHDGTTIDVMPDGRVLIEGQHAFTIDRGGRVFDLENDPIALLEPSGRLLGPDDRALGTVGAMHAALPDEPKAWLSVTESGEALRYDEDGDRRAYGVWVGCGGSLRAHQVCTLVSHLFALRARAMERGTGSPPMIFGGGTGVGIGVGVGVGLGIGFH